MQLNDYIPKLVIMDMGLDLYVFYVQKGYAYHNVFYSRRFKYVRVNRYPESESVQFSLNHKNIRLVNNLQDI